MKNGESVHTRVNLVDNFKKDEKIKQREATAGAWKTKATHPLSYSTNVYSHLCGGDMGVWFYSNSVGLQSSFVKESGRTRQTLY